MRQRLFCGARESQRLDALRKLKVLVNLATPQQIDAARRVMGASCLADLLEQSAAWLAACLGPGRRRYHVGTALRM